MSKPKIKKNDEIIVIAGSDKGRRGKVLRVHADGRATVEGINVAKKAIRPNPQRGIPGGIVDREMPIQISNLSLYNSVTKKADRVGMKTLEDGRKVRYFKSNDEIVDI